MPLQHIIVDSSGDPQVLKSTDGAGHVRIKADDSQQPVYGSSLQSHVVGTPATKVALTDGSGKGPTTYIVDMRAFGKATFVALLSGSTIQHSNTVTWSHDGGSETHSSTALWTDQTGDQAAALTILDNYAHFTLSQGAGTAENYYAYVVGRELA